MRRNIHIHMQAQEEDKVIQSLSLTFSFCSLERGIFTTRSPFLFILWGCSTGSRISFLFYI